MEGTETMLSRINQHTLRRARRRAAVWIGRRHRDQRGATMLEWTLLLAAIALPSYFIIRLALAALVGHYRLVTTVNSLPFP